MKYISGMEQSPVVFENSPDSSYRFSVGGFPFDDDMPRGRQDIRAHLDDLAQRHPEFADQLRCPPWGGEVGSSSQGTWGRKRRGSGSGSLGDDGASSAQSTSQQSSEQEQADEPGPLRGRTRYNHLPQYGLRNTVDMGQQQHEAEQDKGARGQRSWSAPPDNRTPEQPQRFVSRIDINPLNPTSSSPVDGQGKPPVVPKQHPPQQQQKPQTKPTQQGGSTVRHIPIFVEGRDEPVLPKNVNTTPEQIFSERIIPQQHQQPSFGYSRPSHFTSHHQFQPQQQQPPPPPPPPAPQTSHVPPTKSSAFPPQQQKQHRQQQQHHHQPQQPEHHPEQQEEPKAPPPPPKAPGANDPISRVQLVQKDVEELATKVETFVGNSRRDKEYVYLDEMLTRNLLKLDDIETEGKENVRQARKAVIRNIQRCISLLESKVPTPEESTKMEGVDESQPEQQTEDSSTGKATNVEMAKADKLEQQTEENSTTEATNEKVVEGNQSDQQTMEVMNVQMAEANQPEQSQESLTAEPIIVQMSGEKGPEKPAEGSLTMEPMEAEVIGENVLTEQVSMEVGPAGNVDIATPASKANVEEPSGEASQNSVSDVNSQETMDKASVVINPVPDNHLSDGDSIKESRSDANKSLPENIKDTSQDSSNTDGHST